MSKILNFHIMFLFFSFGAFASTNISWQFYGDGIGKNESNNLVLSTDFNEIETSYFQLDNIENGVYKVNAEVVLQDVQKGSEGYSFWNFYDVGSGTISPFTDLFGSNAHKNIEYTIEVKNKKITFWFRLKSAGKVIIKNFSFAKTDHILKNINITDLGEVKHSIVNSPVQTKQGISFYKVYDFNSNESGHPFNLKKDEKKNGIGEFKAHKYYNFDVSKFKQSKIESYDRIIMDIYNPNNEFITFNFSISDELTSDYWSQLNHIETLSPGWNHLNLSLKQMVGERGSVRIFREIDLKKLKKIFITVDPDSKFIFKNDWFYIDNIYLEKSPNFIIPSGILAFDFTSQKAAENNFAKVTTQNIFSQERGFGFVEPMFWKVEDSKYVDEIDRYTIGILKGKFKIAVPNGVYKFSLNIDKLGFWDVPFYKDRTIIVNNQPIFKESRLNSQEFLKDLLRFEDVEPTIDGDIYDTYYSKIFNPIEREVVVKNGFIEFEFFGDESAISLNSLIIWKASDNEIAKKFKEDLLKRKKLEISWLSRSLTLPRLKNTAPRTKLFSVIDLSTSLLVDSLKEPTSNNIELVCLKNETNFALIQIYPRLIDQNLEFKLSDLVNSNHQLISSKEFKFYEVINQYVSPDLNHETYFLGGKFLRPISNNKLKIPKNTIKYILIEFSNKGDRKNIGEFIGKISFNINKEIVGTDIKLNLLNIDLPKVDFPVGFMSLDPLPYSYYKGQGYNELRKNYRFKAMEELAFAGFTTFSGLPEVRVKIENNVLNLDSKELSETLNKARSLGFAYPVFSFGGQFPDKIFEDSTRVQSAPSMNKDEYYLKLSPVLKKLVDSLPLKVVYLFSDEAGGYSDKVNEDYEFATTLRKYFPYLPLGGFGFFYKDQTTKLNNYFEYGLYSKLSKDDINYINSKKLKWGMYNASAGSLDDPRFTFGLGLFLTRQHGLSHYLEWNSVGFNNYPYLDFDGRESDIAIFYPSQKGGLYPSIRFKMAQEGLNLYRKLVLIDQLVKSNKGDKETILMAAKFLDRLKNETDFYSTKTFLVNKNHNFIKLDTEVNKILLNAYK